MGLKDLFIVKEERHATMPTANVEIPTITTETTEVTTSDVLEPSLIYESASIPDGKNNIYRTVAFIEGLPSSLDSIAKKEVLQNMLVAAELDVVELSLDADKRMEALDAYGKGTVDYYNEEVERIDGQIGELRAAISMLEDEKKQKGSNAEEQVKIVKEEITRLKTLQSYVEKGE